MFPEKKESYTFDEFQAQVDTYPTHFLLKKDFIQYITQEDIIFKQVIYSYDNLVKLLLLCPDYKENILNFILERNQVFNSFFFFTNILKSIEDINYYPIISKYID